MFMRDRSGALLLAMPVQGQKWDLGGYKSDVRFTPESGHRAVQQLMSA